MALSAALLGPCQGIPTLPSSLGLAWGWPGAWRRVIASPKPQGSSSDCPPRAGFQALTTLAAAATATIVLPLLPPVLSSSSSFCFSWSSSSESKGSCSVMMWALRRQAAATGGPARTGRGEGGGRPLACVSFGFLVSVLGIELRTSGWASACGGGALPHCQALEGGGLVTSTSHLSLSGPESL